METLMNRLRNTVGAALLVACVALPAPANASHITVFAPVDAIDFFFPAGGGTFTATTTGPSDDAWLAFVANVGDFLTITASGIFGPNVVLFRAGTNGVVEVGDIYTPTGAFNGNVDQTGTGVDLIVQNMMLRPCPPGSGDCYVAPGNGSFLVTMAGQYAIGISPANESSSFVGSTRITLTGNTVPEPTTLLLFGTGLAAVAYRRRQKK